MSQTTATGMTRAEARKILLAHRGSFAQIASELEVSAVTVGLVMRGKSQSARVLSAGIALAEKLKNSDGRVQSKGAA
jgi:hypothetical protein